MVSTVTLSAALAGCLALYRRQRRLSREVAELSQRAEQLAHQAFHDPLTDLPNRELLMDRMERALARAERHKRYMAVLFLDLDRFKRINDSYGHSAGDQALIAVGKRLQASVRPEDTVSRLGGDEFVILLEEVAGTTGATLVAERLGERVRAPVIIAGRRVSVTGSIGIATSASGQDRPDKLLCKADIAMYRAKENGRARYELAD